MTKRKGAAMAPNDLDCIGSRRRWAKKSPLIKAG
jgi:hypothetical protein